MRRLVPGVVLVLLCWAHPGAAQDRPLPPLKRIVDTGLAVRLPIHFCSVPSTVAGLARTQGVVAGVEYLPGDCSAEWEKARPGADEVSLRGMTVEEALNKLVELDGRYRWVESNGVIVMRPVAAWSDPKNVLNFVTPSFDLEDRNLAGALDEIAAGLSKTRRQGADLLATRTDQGSRRFSVSLGATSVGGVLDAVVRAHGAMWWEVSDRPMVADGQPDRMIWLRTFDGAGLGTTTRTYRR